MKETIDFITNNYDKYNFHIVSRAEHDELNKLCKYFKISDQFITINGSPTKKNQLVKNIMNKYDYKNEESILIGDSINDYAAAKDNTIIFYGFNNTELKSYGNYIETFKDLLI